MKRYLPLLCTLFLMTACGTSITDQQTLIAYEETFVVQLADIHATATVDRERLMATVERAGTLVGRAGADRRAMISTLEARGVPILLDAITPAPPSQGENSGDENAPSSVGGSGGGQAAPVVMVTPFTPTPDTAASVAQTGLSNIVIAAGVDANDCPMGISNQFSVNVPEVYVVALARGFQDGTTVISRWRRGEEPVAEFSLTYGAIEEACIWFFIDQTDFTFTPGDYSVTLEVNGIALPPLAFTLQG